MKFTGFYFIAITLIILLATACDTQNTGKNSTYKVKSNDTTSVSSKVNAVDKNTDSSIADSIVYAEIEALPEVNKLENADSEDKRTIMIQERPGDDFKYYWVQAGMMHPERFEPILNFYVTPHNFDILYYDTQNDTTLTLVQWRKKRDKK